MNTRTRTLIVSLCIMASGSAVANDAVWGALLGGGAGAAIGGSVSGRNGAIVGGASEEAERSLAAYGMHLGTAFQIIDDVLDYSGAEVETGKHLGDDLAEGKPTLPLIYVMQHGSPAQAACVRQAIETGGRDDFPQVLEAIRATGALEHTKLQATIEADRARKAINNILPASPYKDSLLELPSFAVARTF